MTDQTADQQIPAQHAEFRKPTSSPWGPEDQIGMLNLITPESRNRILVETDSAKCFDLSVDLFIGMPSWTYLGDPAYDIWMTHTPRGQIIDDDKSTQGANPLLAYSGDCVSMYTHTGTHIDALNHFGYRGEVWNCFKADEHLGSRHWHKCGVEQYPPIVARGILLDVAAMHGVDVLPDSYGIGESDLRDTLKRQGTSLEVGDVVLIRTGRMQRWPDRDAYMLNEPGLNREGAEFLAEAGAMVIGADNIALDQLPSVDEEDWVPVHTYLLAEAGVPILEVAQLEDISGDELYEFAFVAAPLRLKGATAAPLRPIAMPLRK